MFYNVLLISFLFPIAVLTTSQITITSWTLHPTSPYTPGSSYCTCFTQPPGCNLSISKCCYTATTSCLPLSCCFLKFICNLVGNKLHIYYTHPTSKKLTKIKKKIIKVKKANKKTTKHFFSGKLYIVGKSTVVAFFVSCCNS